MYLLLFTLHFFFLFILILIDIPADVLEDCAQIVKANSIQGIDNISTCKHTYNQTNMK